MAKCSIAAIVPCYRVRQHIVPLLRSIGPEVHRIYVIDDCCPDGTGYLVISQVNDPRVRVITHRENRGVGAAVITGYKAALADGMRILVKLDGDGQMNPSLIGDFVRPILAGYADYTKGNRFFNLEALSMMPRVRLIGNAVLSFMTKLSSGYWHIFDPTNGFTAIHADVASHLPMNKISERYFFESDLLFRLNILRAVVVDVPMVAVYANEKSNLKISRVVGEFFAKHMRNFAKRIFYNYYLRDMSLGSIQLPIGLALLAFGTCFGALKWWESSIESSAASAGTVMLAALPFIAGFQLVLAFLGQDIASVPTRPIAPDLRRTLSWDSEDTYE